jgi:peptidoglycan/xylan/chitin deacetylase (PgdA/CDA1 family)
MGVALAGRRTGRNNVGPICPTSHKNSEMSPLRPVLKRSVERALCRAGVGIHLRRWRAGDTLILAWHNIVPDGEPWGGDRSLHLPQRAFARQLDVLRRTHDVVPLAALLDGGGQRRSRPRAVITFDDAYQGAMTAGVEELRQRRLPATVFVAPAFVGGRSYWWDVFTELGSAALSPALRTHALHELGGRDAVVRAWAAEQDVPLQAVPAHMTCATEAQLKRAEDVVAYGSHTWSHPFLPALEPDELRQELEAPRQWLAERFDNVVDFIAYPYGGCSPAVKQAAQEAGYVLGLRVDGGWLRGPAADEVRYALPRHNVAAGLSTAGFELRASGLLTR